MKASGRSLFFILSHLLAFCLCQWEDVSSQGASPPKRRSHVAAFLERDLSLIVFGGVGSSGINLNDTWAFSYATLQWSLVESKQKPPSRRATALTSVSSSDLVLFGGLNNAGVALSDMWKFTTSNGWEAVSPSGSPGGRHGHSFVRSDLGQTLLFGGASTDAKGLNVYSAELFRLLGFTAWSKISPSSDMAPSPRMGHTATVVKSSMLLFGGTNGEDFFNDLWEFRLSENVWMALMPAGGPSARAFHSVCTTDPNMIIYGGETEGAETSSETWIFDNFNQQWTLLNDLVTPIPLFRHTLTAVSPSVCASFGGTDKQGDSKRALREITAHPSDAKWAPIISSDKSPPPRSAFASILVDTHIDVFVSSPDDTGSASTQFSVSILWIFGGQRSNGETLQDVFKFNFRSKQWEEVTVVNSPGPHYGARAVATRHFAVLVGGSLPGSAIWALNLRNLIWREITPVTGASLLQRSMHQASLLYYGGDFLVVDGGVSRSGEILGDVLRLPLDPVYSSSTKNKVLYFNGQSQIVQLWYGATRLFSHRITIEVMFLSTSNTVDGATLLSWTEGSGSSSRLYLDLTKNSLCVGPHFTPTSTQKIFCANVNVMDDLWHHVAVTLDSGVTLYIDGVRLAAPMLKYDLSFSGITSLILGGAFPPSLPYAAATDTDGMYKLSSAAPFFTGYMDNARISKNYQNFFNLSVFPVTEDYQKFASLGLWDFDTLITENTSPDESGNLTIHNPSPAILGDGLFLSTAPKLVSMDLPKLITKSTPRWTLPPVSVLHSSNSNITIMARYSHSSTIMSGMLLVVGGRNDTNELADAWGFNLASLSWIQLVGGNSGLATYGSSVSYFENSAGSSLLYVGGLSLEKEVVLSVGSINIATRTVQSVLAETGHGLVLQLFGHSAMTFSNLSMVVLVGGFLCNLEASNITFVNGTNCALSNRVYTIDLSTPGTYSLASVIVAGPEPTRAKAATPFSISNGEILTFSGSVKDVVWAFDVGGSSWRKSLPNSQAISSSDPGFAFSETSDGSLSFMGHRCESLNWMNPDDESCGLRSTSFILKTDTSQWKENIQTQVVPAGVGNNLVGSIGSFSVQPQFCAYDGTSHTCGETFVDSMHASSDTANETEVSCFRSSSERRFLCAWISGETSIAYRWYSETNLGWERTVEFLPLPKKSMRSPSVIFLEPIKSWVIAFSASLQLTTTGDDADIWFVRNPSPVLDQMCHPKGATVTVSASHQNCFPALTEITSKSISTDSTGTIMITSMSNYNGRSLFSRHYLPGDVTFSSEPSSTVAWGEVTGGAGIAGPSRNASSFLWTQTVAPGSDSDVYFSTIVPINTSARSICAGPNLVRVTDSASTLVANPVLSTNCSWLVSPIDNSVLYFEVTITATQKYLQNLDNYRFVITDRTGIVLVDSSRGLPADCADWRRCRVFSFSREIQIVVYATTHDVEFAEFFFQPIRGVPLNPNSASDSSTEIDPTISARDSVLIAAWASNSADSLGGTEGDFDIWVRRSRDTGSTWTAATPLTTDRRWEDVKPFVCWGADSKDNVAIFWQSTDPLKEEPATIRGAISSDLGVNWSSFVVAVGSSNKTVFTHPTAAFNGFAWVVVWGIQNDPSYGVDTDVMFSRTTQLIPTSDSWSPAASLYPSALSDGGDDNRPSVSIASRVFYVSWQSSQNFEGVLGTDFDPMIAESSDDGQTWTTPLSPLKGAAGNDVVTDCTNVVSLSSPASSLRTIVYATKGRIAWLSWSVDRDKSIRQCASVNDWSDPYLLNDGGRSDSTDDISVALGCSNDTVVAVWEFVFRDVTPDDLVARYRMQSYTDFSQISAQTANTYLLLLTTMYAADGNRDWDLSGKENIFGTSSNLALGTEAISPLVFKGMNFNLGRNAWNSNVLKSKLLQDFPTEALTICVWLKQSSTNANPGVIFSYTTAAATQFETYARINLALKNGGKSVLLRSDTRDLVPIEVSTGLTDSMLFDDKWHHVSFGFDVKSTSFRVQLDQNDPIKGSIGTRLQRLGSPGYFWIGGMPVDDITAPWAYFEFNSPATQYFSGAMSDLFVFGGVKSPESILLIQQLATQLPIHQLRYTFSDSASFGWRTEGPVTSLAQDWKTSETSPRLTGTATSIQLAYINGPNVHTTTYDHSFRWTPAQSFYSDYATYQDQTPFYFNCGAANPHMVIFSTSNRAGTDFDIFFGVMSAFAKPLNSDAADDVLDDVAPYAIYDGKVATVVWRTVGKSDSSDVLRMARSFDDCKSWTTAVRISETVDAEVIRRSGLVLISTPTQLFLLYSTDARVLKKAGPRDLEIAAVQTPANPNFACIPTRANLQMTIPVSPPSSFVKNVAVTAHSNDGWLVAYTYHTRMGLSGGVAVMAGRDVRQMTPALINTNFSNAASFSVEIAIASNDEGVAVLVWSEWRPEYRDLFEYVIRSSVWNGHGWGAAVDVHNSYSVKSGDPQPLSIASDGLGKFILVATDPGDSERGIAAKIVWWEYSVSADLWTQPHDRLNRNNGQAETVSDRNPVVVYDQRLATWFTAWESSTDYAGTGVDGDVLFSMMPYKNYDAFCHLAKAQNLLEASNPSASKFLRASFKISNTFKDPPHGLNAAISSSDGSIALCWHSVHDSSTMSTVSYAWSVDGGSTFVTETISMPLSSLNPTILYAGQDIFVMMWTTLPQSGIATNLPQYDIYSLQIVRSGARFIARSPILITTASDRATSSEKIGATTNANGTVSIWTSSFDSTLSTNGVIRISTDHGRSWARPDSSTAPAFSLPIASASVFSRNLVLTRDLGLLSVFSTFDANGDMDIHLSKGSGGATVLPFFNRDWGADLNPSVAYSTATNSVVVVWQSNSPLKASTPNSGTDFDIMFMTSSDGGKTFSTPAVIHDSASHDYFDDIEPTVVANSDGRFVVTWVSYSNMGSVCGNDGDPFVVESSDGGLTWSEPRALNEDFENDSSEEVQLRVTTTAAGVGPYRNTFLATWTRVDSKTATVTVFLSMWSSPLNSKACSSIQGWSFPAPLNPASATLDSTQDKKVCLATDGNGTLTAAWLSDAPNVLPNMLSTQLVFWWEANGKYIEDATKAHSPIVNGTSVSPNTLSSWIPLSAMLFNGASSLHSFFVTFPWAFTITFWIQFDSTFPGSSAEGQIIFAKTVSPTSNTTDIEIRITQSPSPQTVLLKIGSEYISFPIQLSDFSSWTHYSLAVSRMDRSVEFACNGRMIYSRRGVTLTSVSISGSVYFGNAPCEYSCSENEECCSYYFSLAGYRQNLGFFGRASSIQFWSRALEESELASLAMNMVVGFRTDDNLGTDFDVFSAVRSSSGYWNTPSVVNSDASTDNDIGGIDQQDVALSVMLNSTVVLFDVFPSPDFERDYAMTSKDSSSPTGWSDYFICNENFWGDGNFERSISIATNRKERLAVFTSGMWDDSRIRYAHLDRTDPVQTSCDSPSFAAPQPLVVEALSSTSTQTTYSKLDLVRLPRNGVIGFALKVETTASNVVTNIMIIQTMDQESWTSSYWPVRSSAGTSIFDFARILDFVVAANSDGIIALVWIAQLKDGKYALALNSATWSSTATQPVLFNTTASNILVNVTTKSAALDVAITVGKFNSFVIVWTTSEAYPMLGVTCDSTLSSCSYPVAIASYFGIGGSKKLSISFDGSLNYVIAFDCADFEETGDKDILYIVAQEPLDWNSVSSPHAVDDAFANDAYSADVSPKIACGAQFCISVWSSNSTLQETIEHDYDILYSVARQPFNYGMTWSAPLPVNSDAMGDGLDDTDPHVECDDTACVVTWTRFSKTDSDIFFATTSNALSSQVDWTLPNFIGSGLTTALVSDYTPQIFFGGGVWIIAYISEKLPMIARYSEIKFYSGQYTDKVGKKLGVSLWTSDLGSKLSVKLGENSRDFGSYFLAESSVVSLTSDRVEEKSRLSLSDEEGSIVSQALLEIVPKHRMVIGVAVPYSERIARWDFAAATITVKNQLTGLSELLLIVHGGKTAKGYSSSLLVHNPGARRWEDAVCVGGGGLPRMNGHTATTYTPDQDPVLLMYGNPIATRATDASGHVYRLSKFHHSESSSILLRAACACSTLQTTGVAPTWNRYQKIAVLNGFMFVLDSSAASSSQDMPFLNLKTTSWSTVPGISNPPSTNGYFTFYMIGSSMYIYSSALGQTDITMKTTDLDKSNAAMCGVASPNGALKSILAGQRGIVEIQARSSLGVFISTSSGLTLTVVSTSGAQQRGIYDGSPTFGTFRFVYTVTAPGKYDVRIQAHGVSIAASPYKVEVLPGSANMLQSTAEISKLAHVTANKLFTFSIFARDAFGNLGMGGDYVSVMIARGTDVNVAKVTDNSDGSYTVSFIVQKAGNYTAICLMNGISLSGSPFIFTVAPGAAQGQLATVSNVGVPNGKINSGQGGKFVIQTVDAVGNALIGSSGKDAVRIQFLKITNERAEAVPTSTDISSMIVDNNDGTYTIQFFPFVDGKYRYQIFVNGSEVAGSPFSLEVEKVVVLPDPAQSMRNMIITVAVAVCIGVFFNFHNLRRFRNLFKRKETLEARRLSSVSTMMMMTMQRRKERLAFAQEPAPEGYPSPDDAVSQVDVSRPTAARPIVRPRVRGI